MFRTITRLLFGGEEKTPEDVKSGEVVEEGWLVVNHQENQDADVPDIQQSNSAINADTDTTLETVTSATDPEPTVQTSNTTSNSRAIIGLVSQPKTLAEVTQLTQKAKSCADRHHMSRNAIQRQNRVRQGVQHQSFHLQQPGHRTLSH
ncbi:tumor protein p53-inducible nuclear protein 2 [Thunnus albacares]|uniref:tumor protein p53-inducible nuclear protein 2 n=1 Tax=Thunnus albacares TaxID=8236 RepID=UPI001CF6B158|nr:tumor protein p53-inducible nuclear protein 2 [Thunnus albacares]